MTTDGDIDDPEWRAVLWRELAEIAQAKDVLTRRHEIDGRAAASLLALCAEKEGVGVVEAARRLR
ncbi:hypothetical protein [Amycolatopsis sp. lyj-112]|uniref:hypothetical protein n=1 Tax=Amycolatopsis sp. lyj-112 TaxID=2789288 RepID=UPI00397D6F40